MCVLFFSCNGFNVTESFINSQSDLGVFESGSKYNKMLLKFINKPFYSKLNPTK